jgi:hypothetical protein
MARILPTSTRKTIMAETSGRHTDTIPYVQYILYIMMTSLKKNEKCSQQQQDTTTHRARREENLFLFVDGNKQRKTTQTHSCNGLEDTGANSSSLLLSIPYIL